ncbi:hypothetical protein B0T14DRAFT_439975 [Immersiella caudata]|uniref:Uncharacterized protein n=1 Tax=Immersiella caudata TaxID=314043 RepID=A0AA39TYZ3_9PEZI|nr:hypothetical protein B0T14DRAFT_439975 [Immersiella caudata]
MQLTNTLVAAVALFVPAWGSPVTAGQPLVARQHSATSATVTNFSVTRNDTHVNYFATIQVNPDHPALDFTHATAGTAVPANSGFWTNSALDTSLLFRFNRFPTNGQYRLVLTDTHNVGASVSLSTITPGSDWAGSGSVIYTGPAGFTLV